MLKLLGKLMLVLSIAASVVTIVPSSGSAATIGCYQFTKNMYYNMDIPETRIIDPILQNYRIPTARTVVNPEYTKYIQDINKLHDVLEAEGYPIRSIEEKNKKFGKTTATAVVKFQNAYLSAIGEDPNGILTEATRNMLNQKYGCIQKASIKLTSPNSGILKARGETMTIKWDASKIPNTTDVLIQYVTSQNTGTTTIATKANVRNGDGQYVWTIPNDIALGRYKIIVSLTGNTKSDRSDTSFEIREKSLEVINPTTAPQLAPGERYVINWKSSVGIAKTRDIKINLVGTINSGGVAYPVNVRIAKPQNLGFYTWTVPDRIDGKIVTASSTMSIVLATEDDVHTSTSSNAVILVPSNKTASSITVTNPTVGQRYVVGQNLPIKWNTSGLKETDLVKISLVAANGSEYPVYGSAKNDGQANWTIPATITNANSVLSVSTTTVNAYKIVIMSLANAATVGNGPLFSITPTQAEVSPKITIGTVPASIERGVPFAISWTTNSTVTQASRVRIELVDVNSGQIVETLASDIPSKTNTYTITIPTRVNATNYQSHKLRITPTSGFSSFDAAGSESSNFKITTRSGQLNVVLDKTSVVRGNPIVARFSGSVPSNAKIIINLVKADQTPVTNVGPLSTTFGAGQASFIVPAGVPTGQYKLYVSTTVDTNPVNAYSAEFSAVNPSPVFSLIGNPTITKVTAKSGKTSSMKGTFNFSMKADGVTQSKITPGIVYVVFEDVATGSTTQATSVEVTTTTVSNGHSNVKVTATMNSAPLTVSSNFRAKITSAGWNIGTLAGTETTSLSSFVTPQITFVK